MNVGKYFVIGIGGFLGANLRYIVQTWAAGKWGAAFPYGTLLANGTGSFILALFVTLVTQRLTVAPEWRLFFAVGFVGGYTTFSSFTVETFTLLQQGSWLLGAVNLFGNLLAGFIGVFAGTVLARAL